MLKVGVFGVGHLGKIHTQQWLKIEGIDVAGFYDPNDKNAEEAIQQFNIKRFTDPDELILACDIADIVCTTTAHYAIAKKAITKSRHVFIEKPLTHTLEEGKEIVELVMEANVKCQIGHVERYNPAYLALEEQNIQPMFVEAHRLAQFNPRGTDVSVILDLMIHDIDIILHLVKSPVKRISASGVAVISETADIANARIEFDNGCVANLTSSRLSLKKMRKIRLFQRDAYIGIDFLEKKTEIIKMTDPDGDRGEMDIPIETNNGIKKIISVQMPEIPSVNAINAELTEFVHAIVHNKPVRVTVSDGYKALDVAFSILEKMNRHNQQHNV
jgi:predicted dehydrogenase